MSLRGKENPLFELLITHKNVDISKVLLNQLNMILVEELL
jgi:hypothetical protein